MVKAENANDTVNIGGKPFTTTQNNTEIIVNENEDNPILNNGGVDLPAGSTIQLPNGNVVNNPQPSGEGSQSSSKPSVSVNADGTEIHLGSACVASLLLSIIAAGSQVRSSTVLI